MLPEISTTEPNSPTARAKASATPDRTAGRRLGSTTRQNVWPGPAPRDAAAASASGSSASSTGWTDRTTNGNVTNNNAMAMAQRVATTLTPTGLLGPYSASSVIPATIVGSANGRSMSALM